MKKIRLIGFRLVILAFAATQFALAIGMPSTLGGK
ncbi:MAG: hypothetical protein RLZZ156_2156 [Deinococcota bacterium]|jgi:hypothetical protein